MLEQQPITIAVHNGVMHSDEILAVSCMGILYKDIKIIRTRDENTLATADYRIDVGGKYNPETHDYDHHQTGFNERHKPPSRRFDIGPKRSGFGLIWKHFGTLIIQEIYRIYYPKIEYRQEDVQEIFDIFDNGVVAYVDMLDNGEQDDFYYGSTVPYQRSGSLTSIFTSFNPSQTDICDNPNIDDDLFLDAVTFGKRFIISSVRRILDTVQAKYVLREALDKLPLNAEILILDAYVPWSYILQDERYIKIVIHPSLEGTWICSIPRFTVHRDRKVPSKLPDGSLRKLRIHPPSSMLGLRNEDLAKVTGVPDATFCHMSGFISIAKTKDGAMALAKYILDHGQ